MTTARNPVQPLRIRSILVPLDGSAFAEQALAWAVPLAARARAKLRLVLVHELPSPPPLDEVTSRLYTKVELTTRSAQRDYLRGQAVRLKAEHPVQVVAATIDGAPAEALLRYAEDMRPDFVVMTTHARGGLERAWLGSVADRLLRSLEIPMLLIRPREASAETVAKAERILVALDGSRRAEAALPPAMAVAGLFEAGLTLLQSVGPVPAVTRPPAAIPVGFDQELTAMQRGMAQDYLDSLAEAVTAAGVVATGAAVVSSGAVEAIQAATQAGVDVVALATHGRGGLQRLVLGSVADKLIRAGRVPVLVTRPRGK